MAAAMPRMSDATPVGTLLARDDDERARRTDRLAAVEATFDPLPISVEVVRAWGRLAAAVAQRGGQPRRRQLDLATLPLHPVAVQRDPRNHLLP